MVQHWHASSLHLGHQGWETVFALNLYHKLLSICCLESNGCRSSWLHACVGRHSLCIWYRKHTDNVASFYLSVLQLSDVTFEDLATLRLK